MNRQERLEQLFQTMDAITRWKARRQRREPMPQGLPTHTRMGVLVAIAHGEAQTIKDLAVRFRMTSSAATQLINSLEKDDLVVRKGDRDDRRKTILSITANGKKTLQLAKKRCINILAEMFEPLNERDLQSLQTIQDKMVQHLQTLWTEPSKNPRP